MKRRILSVLLVLAMLTGMLAMTATVSSAATHPFTDVPGWADEYVAKEYEQGIMYVAHNRMSYTSSRNLSIQDNVLGIISFEGKKAKRGTTLYADGIFHKDDYSTVNCGSSSTYELYYYSIELP